MGIRLLAVSLDCGEEDYLNSYSGQGTDNKLFVLFASGDSLLICG
jgi:hypothetical protein